MPTKNENPFPYGTVAWSKWESEQERLALYEKTIRLLTGEVKPCCEQDELYLRHMGGSRGPRAGWPKKWCVCQRCHSEWQATGFPAPVEKGHFEFKRNRLGAWLFPGICESCDDQLHAISPPPEPLGQKTKKRIPYADQ